MEFGTGNEPPILSIAIPTWNRCKSLNSALNYLLMQINNFSKEIEIIISDNGSDDDTAKVVAMYIKQYPQLKIIGNRNATNLGFYGNLMKCRELSSGKFFWVLSDDDYVVEGLITEIIRNISLAKEVAVVYLKNNLLQKDLKSYKLNRDQLLIQEGFKIGLISSVLFLNNKEHDEFIYQGYPNNAFLGFIFLLNAFNFSDEVIVIEGNCLKAANAKPKGYNFFDIFINHMQQVIEYMHFIRFPKKIIDKYRCTYLKNFIGPYYLLYKGEKALKFGDFKNSEIASIHDVEMWTHKAYADLNCYWLYFYPLRLTPSFLFASALKIRSKLLKRKN
jgi:abequosyltransferase